MSPTQAVPRGQGGSFNEACQSILILTAVSWEGNWIHNGPHICLRGQRPILHSQPKGGLLPSAEGEMTVHIWEARFRTFDR